MSAPFSVYVYGRDFQALPVDFEAVVEAIEPWPRMFLEPDGSFVWRGGEGEERWQIDGMIYDAQGRIQYVDLKGFCPRRPWDALAKVLAGGERLDQLSVLVLPEQERMRMKEFQRRMWPVDLSP